MPQHVRRGGALCGKAVRRCREEGLCRGMKGASGGMKGPCGGKGKRGKGAGAAHIFGRLARRGGLCGCAPRGCKRGRGCKMGVLGCKMGGRGCKKKGCGCKRGRG